MGQGAKEKNQPDAGLRNLDHYRSQLPTWRYWPRQTLLPLVRYETPYLAWFQEKIRSPSLDSYFAFAANLGTHTFFTVFLPILFWCGYPRIGRGMVHVLASGVFFSGFVKDLLCLPRPLSPPLQRITMSGSAALEYGFPSTHSTNAVSVAIYVLAALNSPDSAFGTGTNTLLQALMYLYVGSIVLGRLYCGMHGFFDVIIGCMLGAFLAFVQCSYGDKFDEYIIAGGVQNIIIVTLVVLALVRLHPEPADDCPCFDDSVSFVGVFLGAQIAGWQFARSSVAWTEPWLATAPYRFETLGLSKTVLRIVFGVILIFTWRETSKPFLLRILPPIFRGLSKLGLLLPRRFFTQAPEYTKVPSHLKDHDVLPNFSDIPSIITNMRHPRRRAVSVGPQSEADAYETLAYRQKRRRESLSDSSRASPAAEGASKQDSLPSDGRPAVVARAQSKLNAYENMMGSGSPRPRAAVVDDSDSRVSPVRLPEGDGKDPDEAEVFSRIKKPRVRYDVEVVTRLIVYAGIAWLVVSGGPVLFDVVGLGVRE